MTDEMEKIISHLEKTILPDGLILEPDTTFIASGLDSLLLASLELYLQKHYHIETGFLTRLMTPRECAEKLIKIQRTIQDRTNEAEIATFPLSQAQKRILFSASKQSPLESIQIRVPNLDVKRFSEAWELVSSRHSILRTRLSLDTQRIFPNPIKINDPEIDVLESPLRISVTNGECVQLDYHHALIDGTSVNLLMSELADAYEDLESVKKRPIPRQYYQYCLFEKEHFEKDKQKWDKIVDYWVNELKGFEGATISETSGMHLSIEYDLNDQLWQKLNKIAVQNEMTVFNLMTSLIRLLFYKLYDTDDLVIGFPVEQRLHSDFSNTIGLFMNPNFCRIKLNSSQTMLEFANHSTSKTIEALKHGHIPFNYLINALQAKGVIESEQQLMSLIIVNDKQTRKHHEVETIGHSMNYPQIWYLQSYEKKLQLRIEFDDSKFSTHQINEELRFFEILCQKFLFQQNTRIADLSLFEEKLVDPIQTIPDFLHRIMNTLNSLPSDKIVLISHRKKVNAKDLLYQVWNVSYNLRNIIGDGNKHKFVAFNLSRSFELVVSLLGAWLNEYIVILLDYNQDDQYTRLPSESFLVTDHHVNHPRVILIEQLFSQNYSNSTPNLPSFNPNDLCYCTFTSGSTGEPKLVMSERIGLSNLLLNYSENFGYNQSSIVYQVVNPAFDIFLADVIVSLANGSTLVLAKNQIPSLKEIEQYKITHAYIMPAYLPNLCSSEALNVLSSLKILMFGGESVSEKFVCEALKYNIKLVQLFGFTEHAVYTNYQWIHSVNDCNLIGTSFSGTKVIVVDKDGQPKPDGFEGQLASIGIGVSRGYYLLEENTTFKMFKGQRMFLSGDICRKDLNGIKFLGRKDDVVKFNGQKVNLSLVDRMLCSLDGVEQVSTIKDDHRLISFLITHHSIEEIQSQMKRKWPNWTIPLMLHRVDSLSLTSNGKIDKSKLKSSIKNDSVVEVFQRFLGKDYKLDDDFLSAGVDSIQLLQVAQLLDERFGIELDVRNAFKSRNGREWIKTSKSNLEIKIGVASYNQEHLWLLGDISPEFADSYKIQFKLKFYSPIDKQRLQSAINRIIEENESLRICVKMDENNQIKQFLLPYKYDIDFKSLPISYQFLDDISVRIELHHIAVDGYSLFLIVNQLASYYTDVFQKGRSIFSPIEFAKNQRQMNFAREIEYFRFQLSTCLNDVLPTEFDRSVSNLAGHERITISFNLKNNSYSLFYVTLTAYLKHLSNETNTKSLVIAIPFSNRTSRNANAIGYFTNALPVHFDLNGKDGDKLIEYVRDRVLETLQFSEIPFSLLVRKLEPRRTKLVNPIYQRMFSFEDFYVTEVDGIFSIHEIDSSHSKLDQTWHVHKIDQKTLQIHVEYNSHLFSLNRINQSLNSFKDEFLSLIRDDDDVQKRLFRLFREELLVNEEDLSEKSNFFELGGHSLSAARLASRIRSEIRMECSTRDIFENQTIKELVIMLKKETSSNFVEVSNIQATILRVMAENKSNVLRSQYSNEFQVIIENRDREEIKEMIFQIIATQEALRTKFVIRNGQFMMQCLPIKNINLPYTIISEDFEMETVFIDLREKNELCVRISHLVSDGPSMSILMRYLTEKIKPKSSISEFNTKFNKYCLEFKDKNVQFWASIMKFKNSAIFCDQHVQNPSKSSSLSLCISRQALIEKVINKKVSLNAFLLHKLASTLKHWEIEDSNSTDLYIGIVKDMRSSIENADFSQTIGFFTQTLPIPCKNRNLIELDKLLHNSYDHAFINYESLLEVSNQANLFEVMLAVNYEEKSQVETNQSIDVKGKFPLTFYVQIGKNEAHIELVYWNELWFEDTARSMLETFASMIDPSICQPETPSIQTPIIHFEDPVEAIHRQSLQKPNSIAIHSHSISFTYSELSQRLQQMAAFLINKHIEMYGQLSMSDCVIMVLGKKSVKTVLVCLAVMNAGGAYLPVDENINSPTRIGQIYNETKAKWIISDSNSFDLPNWISVDELWSSKYEPRKIETDSASLAYIIYTSGTSGPQKAAQIERRSLWNTIKDSIDFFSIGSDDCVYQFTNFCFDNSVLEMFSALANGSRLFIDECEFSVEQFKIDVEQFRITHAFLYPGLVDTFTNEELTVLTRLKYWIVGAEKLGESLFNRALDLGVNIMQSYGPTETTCYALRRKMQRGDHPQNLGKPVPGLNIRFFPKDVPNMAAPKELLISGIGLMRGYIGDATRGFVFIDGEKFYKTGDLCRKTRDGDILFIGRKDNVTKVRGYRVDLNEIEAVLLRFKNIKQAKVLSDHENIRAYFVTINKIVDLNDIRKHCIKYLPRYAVPNLFHQVDEMPLTPNNKIDIHTLLKIATSNKRIEADETEDKIVEIWSDMFKQRVGLNDSFFEIGGNSLNAQIMLNQLKSNFGIRLTISDLITNPTIHELRQLLKSRFVEVNLSITAAQQMIPLSFQQEQMLYLEGVCEPGSYNLQFIHFFTKHLKIQSLFDALKELFNKHEILRTRILYSDEELYQQIMPNSIKHLEIEQISDKALRQLILDESVRPFDLFTDLPLRVRFFEVDSNRYCLFVEMHHYITDATSSMLIEGYISNSYNGLQTTHPAITYAQWSIQQKSPEKLAEFKRLTNKLTQDWSKIGNSIKLDEVLSMKDHIRVLKSTVQISNHIKSTKFIWFCTHLVRVFTSEFQQNTLIIGAPVQNRNYETFNVLGNFLNNIIVALKYDNKWSFEEAMEINEKEVARSMCYSELPFSFIANQQRSNKVPLYDVYVNFRYSLENGEFLKIQETCDDFLLEDYLPLHCYDLLEIDVDEVGPNKLNIIWRTKFHDALIDRLFNRLISEISASTSNEDPIKLTIRKSFQKTLPNIDFNDNDDYFLLGGTSLTFVRLYRILKSELDLKKLSAVDLISNCSVNSIYEKLTSNASILTNAITLKLILKGSSDLFVFFPPLFGGLLVYTHIFKTLREQLPKSTIVGVNIDQPSSFLSIKELADRLASSLEEFISKENVNINSIHFIGASFGALLAYETSHRIKRHGFRSLISLDGIGNSNLVNSDVTFDAHKEQTEQSLIDFDLDEETRKEMVLNSWHLLNLSIKHSISTIDLPQLDLFLLMIARQTTTKDYGWPKQRGMYRLLKVDGDHLSMMNEERSTSLVRRVIEEICRAKNSKRQ